MAYEQVAAREGLGADLADKGLLLGVRANVSLKVFLRVRVFSQSMAEANNKVSRVRSYQACKETLAMRARESFGLVARLLPFDPARGRRRHCRVHGR